MNANIKAMAAIQKAWSTRSRWLPLLSILVSLLAVWQLLSAIYFFAFAPSPAFSTVAAPRAAASATWQWFSRQQAPVKVAKTENIQQARIKAKLLGVIQAQAGNVAIIDNGKRGESQVFHVGSSLANNVTIQQIEPKQVLINENGVLRRIELEVKRSASSGFIENVDEPEDKPILAGVGLVETETGDTGLSLRGLKPAMLKESALEPNDVVIQVAGNAIADILASPQDFQDVLNQESIEVVVLREGAEQTVSVDPSALLPGVMNMIKKQ